MAIPVTPGLIDAILVAVALELAAGSAFLVQRSESRLIVPLLLYLGSGAFLLLALRAALAGSDPRWIALALSASFLAHGAGLWRLHRALLRAPSRRGGA